MSSYSNFVGYAPEKLRIAFSGVADPLVPNAAGQPIPYIASLTTAPCTRTSGAANIGISFSAAATNMGIVSGCTYFEFQNLTQSAGIFQVTGATDSNGTPLTLNFTTLASVENLSIGVFDRSKTVIASGLTASTASVSISGTTLSTGYLEVDLPNFATCSNSVTINAISGNIFNLDKAFKSLNFVQSNFTITNGQNTGTQQMTPATGDFLSGLRRVGNTLSTTLAPNITNIGLALGLEAGSVSHTLSTGVTGVQFPRCPSGAGTFTATSSTGATGDLTITTVGPVAPVVIDASTFAKVYSINQQTSGKTLTVLNSGIQESANGQTRNSVVSSGDLFFSGGPLILFRSQASNNGGNGISTFRATRNLSWSTTGTRLSCFCLSTSDAENSSGGTILLESISGTVTGQCPNALQLDGLFVTRIASGINLLSFPEATGGSPANFYSGLIATGSLAALSPFLGMVITTTGVPAGSGATGILNIPKLHGINGQISITGVSGTSITISGADLTYMSGILGISSSGTVNFTFTGGPGSGSGTMTTGIDITGLTTGSVISGNLGTLRTISGNFRVNCSGSCNITASGLREVSGFVTFVGPTTGTFIHPLQNTNTITGIATSPLLTGATNSPFFRISGNSITGVVATGLQTVGIISGQFSYNSGQIVSTGITNVDLRSLSGWYSQCYMVLPNVTGFNMSGIKYFGSTGNSVAGQSITDGIYFELGSSLTGNLNFGALTDIQAFSNNASTIGNSPFTIIGSGLTSVTISGLVSGICKIANAALGGTTGTGIIRGANITGLTFGTSGTTKTIQMNFTASGCPLNQTSVDNILQTFASLDGTNGTTVYSGRTITLNGLCAAPSAAGSGFRTTLTGAGRLCTVLVN